MQVFPPSGATLARVSAHSDRPLGTFVTTPVASANLASPLCAGRKSGQGTVEWVALIALVSLALAALAWAVGLRVPGTALANAIAERIVCAVRLSHGCRSDPELVGPYGAEVAALVRANGPRITYESGMRALPVDFRDCRSPACADGPATGRAPRSLAGQPVTAFTHVIDCRDPSRATALGYVCAGERSGRIYLQYWLYYANSATLRGVPVAGAKGFHLDDWESVQTRIDPDGAVWARASSHRGYNGGDGIGNWPSDLGWGRATAAAEALGARHPSGWTPSEGELFVSGGSHGGHVSEGSLRRDLIRVLAAGTLAARRRPRPGTLAARDTEHEAAAAARRWEQALFPAGARHTPRGSLRLVPLEALGDRDSYSFAVTPPWRKRVYYDPEYTGTD
jgi:hypothetical protein